MAGVGPLRGVWRRAGVATSEVMKESSLIMPVLGPPVQILPQQLAPYLSSASTSCSTIVPSHCRPCPRVWQDSSHTIRHQWQRMLLLDNKLPNGRFSGKHFPSLFHGDARALKQQELWPKEKSKDAFNLYFAREPKKTLDVQSFNRPFDESYRPQGNYPSLVTQLPTALEPQFPSASVDQSKTRDWNAPGNLDQSASSSTFEVVQPGSKVSSKPVPTVSTISEHRRSRRAEKGTSDQRAPSPNDGRPGPRLETSYMLGKPLPKSSNRIASRNSTPNSWKQIEAGVESKTVFSMYMDRAGSTSEAIAVLQNRLQRGIIIGSYAYVKVLQMCLKQKDLTAAKHVQECIIQSGMDKNPYVATTLLNTYIKCGGLLDARRVFDELETKDVVTWNMMIAGYARSDDAESALELFKLMRQDGEQPDEVTYLCILKAFATPSALTWGKQVHECIQNAGFESDVRVGTALLQMYAKCGSISEARRVFDKLTNRDFIAWSVMIGAYAASGNVDNARQMFDRMNERDLITWNIMIGAYAESGRFVEAYRLFLEMRREGFEPDAFTYMTILNASATPGALDWVKEVHGHASKAGLGSDLRVGTALVHMYAESGSIDDARRVFDSMEKRDVITWNVLIGGLAHHGCGHEALALFRKMNAARVKPDGTTFVAVLSACCHGGLLDDGRRLFLAMTQDYGIEPDIVHYTCMVDLLGRAGRLEEAKVFIFDMPIEPTEVTWTALLGACRTYGNVELGELAAKEVFKLEPSKAATYVLLSNIYAAAGKWDKVSLVRTMMQNRGVRKDPGRSWIEVDNKVHEFVVGDTSHPEAKAIYIELNKLTEKLKAEGYIPDTRLVLHDINEEDKELALCSHSEKLAIAYGLLHIPWGEPIRIGKNLRVCPDCHTATKFISRVTGREIIARDANRYHRFKGGVCSCGDYW